VPRKAVPDWARGQALRDQLAAQLTVDPDEIFQQHKKTCALSEVFGHDGESCNCAWLPAFPASRAAVQHLQVYFRGGLAAKASCSGLNSLVALVMTCCPAEPPDRCVCRPAALEGEQGLQPAHQQRQLD